MKSKKLRTMLVSLGLVSVVGAGATLAYFSDNTQELTNTFTFTDKGIDITLDEAKVDPETNQALTGDEAERIQEGETQAYVNLQPGAVLDKDPTVTVVKNSVNCNVFVSVNNANDADILAITDLDTASWDEIETAELTAYGFEAADNTRYFVYKGANGDAALTEDGDVFTVVPHNKTADNKLEAVFNHVQVGADITGKEVPPVEFKNIVIKAAAVQADNCTDTVAAQSALGMLGAKEIAAQ